ncbi:hypothetical protein [Paracoccus sp. MC1862]|uniref:hypothetical protein n=1 Tax=Paracoccus sp. MC1862 TaxID=2760307 RepID=UPI0016011D71|nr:hypothetical protein [Paracoccus sp. MC1862]MBB1498777.1 hypothetical protein [Paracoccus sp. MC1862]QQO43937.1 hypothetical protein JGR78_10950 [Paracoccus sp. MC1862]
MSGKSGQLEALARLARIKADADLRRYAAYRVHAEAMQRQIDALRTDLAEAIATPGADRLDQWRLTTAVVAYRTGQAQRAEIALARMKPGLAAAQRAATLAFGRAEALSRLQQLKEDQERRKAERRN